MTPEDVDAETKKCMKLFSAKSDPPAATFGWKLVSEDGGYTLEDYAQNGKYCSSGLAYNSLANQAKCTQTKKVFHDWQEIENSDSEEESQYVQNEIFSPYKCEPQDPNMKCKIQFHIEEDDVSAGLATFDQDIDSNS